MRLTDKQKTILESISRLGNATISEVRVDTQWNLESRDIKPLRENGFIKFAKTKRGRADVYLLSEKGVEVLNAQ